MKLYNKIYAFHVPLIFIIQFKQCPCTNLITIKTHLQHTRNLFAKQSFLYSRRVEFIKEKKH